jgi:type I restriction enzyme, R subunit
MPEPIDELARRSRNFGFLLQHEPLLVMDGAAAESYLYSDPDAAMAKARRFTETLAKLLVRRTQTRVSGSAQDARIKALADAGVLVPRIRQAFDEVRISGNRAVHSHWGDVRAALSCLRTCYELGVWFHRAVTGEPFLQGFVPPPDPAAQAQATSAEHAELQELRQELARQRERLAEVKVHRDGRISGLEADARARRQAEEELARALAGRQELRSLVEQAQQRLTEAEARFTAEMGRAQRVKAVQRDAFIARAQQAAAEPLTEAEVRERVDQMLRLAGWAIQNANATNLFAADGVAVREVATAEGVADYLLYVDQKLAGVVEAKREGTILSPVDVQSSRYAGSLTASQQFAAWRIPLPFRYETTAVETHFTNTLDPVPRARQVYSFHRPQTLARWMREAGDDPEIPTFRARLQGLPPLDTRGLRAAQTRAIIGLEDSLGRDEQRALIQMATGVGKTYMAVTQTYRARSRDKQWGQRRRAMPFDGCAPRQPGRVASRSSLPASGDVGVVVRNRYSVTSFGEVTGYAVGLPAHTTKDGQIAWYGGEAGCRPDLAQAAPPMAGRRPGTGPGPGARLVSRGGAGRAPEHRHRDSRADAGRGRVLHRAAGSRGAGAVAVQPGLPGPGHRLRRRPAGP